MNKKSLLLMLLMAVFVPLAMHAGETLSVNDRSCQKPSGLASSEITATSAHISWSGDASTYDLRYAVMPGGGRSTSLSHSIASYAAECATDQSARQLVASPNAQPNTNTRAELFRDGWYYYDNGTYSTSIGVGGSTIYWGSMFPAGTYTENCLTKVALYENSYNTETVTLYVCSGGDTAPGELLYTEEFEPVGGSVFHEVTLATPVVIDPSENLWIIFGEYGTYPANACVDDGEPNNRWISLNGTTWQDVADAGVSGYGWMIRAYLTSFDPGALNWTNVYGLNAYSYDLTNLDPETHYVVQVRSNCGGNDGQSEWVSTTFTTLPTCVMPTDLAVIEFTAHEAVISWTPGANETSWQICLNDQEERPINVTANPYTLTDLAEQTDYTVKIRSNCGGGDYSEWTNNVSFTTDIACHAPANLTANNITPFSALMNWNGNSGNYEVRYGLYPVSTASTWLTYNVTPTNFYGSQSASTKTWGVMYPASQITGNYLTKVNYYESNYNAGGTTVISVYSGGDNAPRTLLYTEVVTPQANAWNEIILAEPVAITTGENLWITLSETGTFALSVGDCNDDNNRWILSGGSWTTWTVAGKGWCINGYMETLDFNAVNWTTATTTETSYAISGLTPETHYVVEVRSNCGSEGYSVWSFEEFTTMPPCVTPTELTITDLTAHSAVISWTAGFNETSWQICINDDEAHPINVAENPYTLTGLPEQTTYTVKIRSNCGGGDYSEWSENVSFTTDIACYAPADLAVDNITPFSALLSWSGNSGNYELRYGEYPESTESSWLTYNVTVSSNYGSSTASTRTWGTKYLASQVTGNYLTKIEYYYNNNYNYGEDIIINVYSGGDNAPGTLLYSEMVIPQTSGVQVFAPALPIEIATGENLWITFTETGTYILPCGPCTDDNNRWIVSNGSWTKWSTGINNSLGWCINGYMENLDFDSLDLTTTTTETTCTLSDLTPETHYAVQVRSNCGSEGYSLWTLADFYTPSACLNPVLMGITDIQATSATLAWEGVQNNFNVQWRVSNSTVILEEGFEGTIDEWTLVDCHDNTGISTSYPAYNGEGLFRFYYSTTPPQYLISPMLAGTDNGLQVSFFYEAYSSYYIESFQVGYSTTTNDVNAFVFVDEISTNITSWQEYSKTFPAGTKYVAVKYTAYDQFYLFLDDFKFMAIGSNAWQSATSATSPYTITGLTPETTYEARVQGLYEGCEGGATGWSDIVFFTTPEQTTVTQVATLAAGTNWFSTYLEITLDDLKAALAAATPSKAITIKSSDGKTAVYSPRTHTWSGQLTSMDVVMRYNIIMAEASEITLEGMPIDPAEHPITILGGGAKTWIGFPYSESMTPGTVFAGFAVNGDKIKSGSGANSTFSRNQWSGQVTTLEPGQGYLYTSPANAADRVFVFPSPLK